MKPSLKLLTAAILMTGLSNAQAMPYTQFIVFGDSLSDSGQFPDAGSPLLGGNPTGGVRFTNRTGPNYQSDNSEYFDTVSTQRLASLLGLQALPSTPVLPQALTGNADGTNYAVGGYTTAQILASITDPNGSVVNSGIPALSRTKNGYLVDFGKADPNALYYVNGGGNDILGNIVVDAATASTSAANLVAGVAALQRAGARYIIVSDLPDVGLTPLGAFTGASSNWSINSELLNQALATQLSALGGNVIRLNFRALLNEVKGELANFGFDPNVIQTDVCFDSSGGNCAPDPTWGIGGTSPNPDRLMFNDGVHPTAAVQQISADYTYSILSAPWEITLLPEMAMASLNGHQQQLRSEWQSERGAWQAVGQWSSFVSASGMRQQFQRGEAVSEGDSDGLGVNLGGSYRLHENWRLGLALGLQHQQLDSESDSQYDLSSYLLSAFAQYQQNRLWADASFSLGMLDYGDLDRQFDLGITQRTESGDTDGQLYALSGRIGYDLANEDTGWRVSPFISADLARVDVDGYREKGNRSTALEFGDQQRDSRRLGVGVQVNYQLTPQTQLFAEVAREREFEDDINQLEMNLNSVSGDHFELQGHTPADGQTTALVGVSQVIAGQLKLVGSYHFRGTEDRQHGVNIGLSLDW